MRRDARLTFGVAVSACTAAVLGAACSASPPPMEGEDAGTTASPIVGGTASDASQNEVVLVIHHSAGAEVDQVCSGTLLAPNLVLTARHCVATADSMSQCASDGTTLTGGQVGADYDPSELYVFAGAERPTTTPLAPLTQRASAIIDDGSKVLCNHDLALLILATAVPNAEIAPVRLDTQTAAQEKVTLVGWGVTDETEKIPTARQQRTDVPVLDVGPSVGLASAELSVGEGPCGGDSGGPALAASGAVIGALSRGGNGVVDAGEGSCVGATSVYTETSGFRDLILSAYARAGATPWLESQPSPAQQQDTTIVTKQGGCAEATNEGGTGAASVALAALVLGGMLRRRRVSRP